MKWWQGEWVKSRRFLGLMSKKTPGHVSMVTEQLHLEQRLLSPQGKPRKMPNQYESVQAAQTLQSQQKFSLNKRQLTQR
jgi:hypothetical protein